MNILNAIRLPDLFSILNAILGFGSILTSYKGEPNISVLLIILAAVTDGMDGFIARRFGSGQLGMNLDSLADLVSFGVAPAFLAFTTFNLPLQTGILGGFYLTCGILRLARFNVSPKNNRFFEGLPIPPCGIAVAASVLLGWSEVTLILMLILSVLMISSISYPKIRGLHAVSSLFLIFLAITITLLAWMKNDPNFNYEAALPYSIVTTLVIYLVSPVVIPFLQKER